MSKVPMIIFHIMHRVLRTIGIPSAVGSLSSSSLVFTGHPEIIKISLKISRLHPVLEVAFLVCFAKSSQLFGFVES